MASNSDGPVCVKDFEDIARRSLTVNTWDYYRSGADDEFTLRENETAFFRYPLRPRVLRDVTNVNTGTRVLGSTVSFPVCIAPSAMQRMAHPDGEEATARAAAKAGTLMILSTLSTTSLEDVAQAGGPFGGPGYFFQLYIYKDREITRKLVARAEAAGYKALVLTVDTPVLGNRRADARNRFSLPAPYRLENFHGLGIEHVQAGPGIQESGLFKLTQDQFDASLSWKDIAWLKTITKLPIVAKGILTAEDAKLAVNAGVSAILVSNHGARQLDGVQATIEALREVVDAVKGRCEVYLDGGVRRGTDVFKALALGAKAVFIGRPVLWGLAYKGEQGVSMVLEMLRREFVLAMMLCGCTSVDQIDRSFLKINANL